MREHTRLPFWIPNEFIHMVTRKWTKWLRKKLAIGFHFFGINKHISVETGTRKFMAAEFAHFRRFYWRDIAGV